MTKIIAIKLQRIGTGYPARAQLLAGLAPFGLQHDPAVDRIGVRAALYKLRDLNTLQFNQFHELALINKTSSFWHPVNCPPPFISTSASRTSFCRRRATCPFCWMRSVKGSFNLVWQFLYPPNQADRPDPLALVTVVNVYTCDLDSTIYTAASQLLRAARNQHIPLAKHVLGSATVEPGPERKCKLSCRLLALMEPDSEIHFETDSSYLSTISRIGAGNFTGYELANAVGSTLAYPAGLLTGDPTFVADLLNLKSMRRSSRLLFHSRSLASKVELVT